MIKIKISELLGKHKMTQRDLVNKTDNIRPNAISAYYHETVQRIDKDHLNQFCKVFKCPISDILEYIPDEEDNKDS